MKIEIEWIKSAQEALIQSGIVQTGCYPKSFKGYISSLGAAIVQSGAIPALSIYEADNDPQKSSGSSNNRALLINAIVKVIEMQTQLFKNKSAQFNGNSNPVLLANYLASVQDAAYRADLLRAIDRALVALKLAIRIYTPNNMEAKDMIRNVPAIHDENPAICGNGAYSNTPNLGWIFYRDLYRNYLRKDNISDDIKGMLGCMFGTQYKDFERLYPHAMELYTEKNGFSTFLLTTHYPGLLAGSGLSHGIKDDQDIKAGFLFDYTTGMPYLPGSSVKGALRSFFPQNNEDTSRISYISYLLKKIAGVEVSPEDILSFTQQLFDDNESSSHRCIFMDAMITHVDKGGRFIGNDYITPHPSPVKEPNPLQFLKVLPKVTFTFAFRLPNECKIQALDKGRLKKLFKQILMDGGIGAKTNVGYGHMIESSEKDS